MCFGVDGLVLARSDIGDQAPEKVYPSRYSNHCAD